MSTPAPFLHDDWLLSTPTARRLYHEHAAGQPIIDYHNHLPPAQVAHDHHFADLHAAWLAGDHYKWRAMRTMGVDERLVTGDAPPEEKFAAYAKTVPATLRNPLYHWSHLELKRYFGFDGLLSGANAQEVFAKAQDVLDGEDGGTWGLLRSQNVEVICTTDDPTDTLEPHAAYAKTDNGGGFAMYPTFRPDKAIQCRAGGWRDYLSQLGRAAGIHVNYYDDLLEALRNRLDHFHAHGCRLADHGLRYVPRGHYSRRTADDVLRSNSPISDAEAECFGLTLLTDLGYEYAARDWTMQLHLGALRNNNARALREQGPDTGYDSIGDFAQAESLSAFLNRLADRDRLPRTILYNLNPADDAAFATMTGNFQGGGVRGRVQWGSAWWFNDQWDGMTRQLDTLSNMGLLAPFVGMLTDSRSFLSFPRHEYFRRLLCELLGRDVAAGRLPGDEGLLGGLVEDVCYRNARGYFGFERYRGPHGPR